jgi:VWFA-related protein
LDEEKVMLALLLSLLHFAELEVVKPKLDTFAGVTAFEIKSDLNKIDILGLEILINGESAHYFDAPPFETNIDFSAYPEGEIEIEIVLEHFLPDREAFRHVIKGTNFPNYYEEQVRLIRIPVTVDQPEGSTLLTNDDFLLYEDEEKQPIELLLTQEQPLDLVFLLDTSGSMERKMPFVVRAAQQMMDRLQPEDRVSVIGFNDRVFEVIGSTTDKKRAKLRMVSLKSEGGTNIWGAVYAGSKILARSPMRRAIVIFTDGQHEDGAVPEKMRKTLEDCIALALSDGVPIYAMGVPTGKTKTDLEQLAVDSGGRYYPMRNNRAIRDAFQQISDNLRRQYLLCYNTNRNRPGHYKIEVKAPNHPEAKLHYPKSIQIISSKNR